MNSGAPEYKTYIYCPCMNKMYGNGIKECVVKSGLPSISYFSVLSTNTFHIQIFSISSWRLV